MISDQMKEGVSGFYIENSTIIEAINFLEFEKEKERLFFGIKLLVSEMSYAISEKKKVKA